MKDIWSQPAAFCLLPAAVVGGEEQDSGFRSQESGVRMKSICSPPAAFCLLPTAYCLLHLGSARVARASRIAGPLRSQNRPRIGRGDRDVARVRGAHT